MASSGAIYLFGHLIHLVAGDWLLVISMKLALTKGNARLEVEIVYLEL